jgi:5-methylcytosine-specific restriction endonuclease McrA
MKGTGHRDDTGDHYVRQSPEYYAGLVERMLVDFRADDSIDHQCSYPFPHEAEDMGLDVYESRILHSYLRHRVNGNWPVSLKDLARQCHISVATSCRARRSLQAMGWVPRGWARAGPRRHEITPALRRRIWGRDKYTCLHCGGHRHLSIDHIIPRSKGGRLYDENLQTLCRSCNSRKGAKV